MPNDIEYWLSGPIADVAGPLQPIAHALLQARREVLQALTGFPGKLLWAKPAGVASVGFHLQHIAGVLDRLFTYARGEQLNPGQMNYLASEGKEDDKITLAALLEYFSQAIDNSITGLKAVNTLSLADARGVGRKQLPSTVAGLLFHAAEHTMRHTGQLLVTVKVLTTADKCGSN